MATLQPGNNAKVSDLSTPSDLGRRIRGRREALGLSVESVASRAAIDPGYLEYLETSAVPDPTRGTVLRLAAALDTAPVTLLGDNGVAPSAPATGERKLVDLDRAKSLERIGTEGVGRVAFVEERGAVALPVNYAVVDGDIIFRTDRGTSIATGADGDRISFEVDRVSDSFDEGWSVLVTGMARPVGDPHELEGAFHLPPVTAGGQVRYFRLTPEMVTGRELRRQHG